MQVRGVRPRRGHRPAAEAGRADAAGAEAMTRAGAGAGGRLAQPVLVRRMLIGCYVLWKFKRMMDKTRDETNQARRIETPQIATF